jgi:hypothetical protein
MEISRTFVNDALSRARWQQFAKASASESANPFGFDKSKNEAELMQGTFLDVAGLRYL